MINDIRAQLETVLMKFHRCTVTPELVLDIRNEIRAYVTTLLKEHGGLNLHGEFEFCVHQADDDGTKVVVIHAKDGRCPDFMYRACHWLEPPCRDCKLGQKLS